MVDIESVISSPSLPTLPSAAVRLVALSKDPEIGIGEIVKTINNDPAISAKVIKAVNSSFFGLSSQVASVEKAVPLLGTNVVTSLALSFSLVNSSQHDGSVEEQYRAFWTRSFIQAAAAELLEKRTKRSREAECFLAGLLADVGWLAMLNTIPQRCVQAGEISRRQGKRLHDVEVQEIGFTHVDVGQRLMEIWGIPDSLRDAAKYHHTPPDEWADLQRLPHFGFIQAVFLASGVADYFLSDDPATELPRLRAVANDLFGFDENGLQEFLGLTHLRAVQAQELIAADANDIPDPKVILEQANAQLSALVLKERLSVAIATARSKALEDEKVALEARNQQLQTEAVSDALTGLFNRRACDEYLARAVNQSRQQGVSIGVLFIDIDRFKSVNDQFGHDVGDQVLRSVAQSIKSQVRDRDLLARYGGEEFVVVSSSVNTDILERIAERIRTRVAAEEITAGPRRLSATVSVGGCVAPLDALASSTGEQIVQCADAAMYDCKKGGRNRSLVRTLETRHAALPASAAEVQLADSHH